MTKIEKAKEILEKENATCVSLNDNDVYISHKHGVSTILDEIDKNKDCFRGASVADRVVGKSAAMLFENYGVKELHALVASHHAIEYLINKDLIFTYDKSVEYIANRDGTDMCPMEKSVLHTYDAYEGEKNIRETLQMLRQNN
jgi:hypothetical protein